MGYFPTTKKECAHDIKVWQQILCDAFKARNTFKRVSKNLRSSGYQSLYEYQQNLALNALERLRELRALMPQL